MTPMMNDIPFIILNDKTIISFKNYRSFFFERYYGVIEEFDNYTNFVIDEICSNSVKVRVKWSVKVINSPVFYIKNECGHPNIKCLGF